LKGLKFRFNIQQLSFIQKYIHMYYILEGLEIKV